MLYYALLFIGFLEAIGCFVLMTTSTMKMREPVRKNVMIALSLMLLMISLFFAGILVFSVSTMEFFAIAITLVISGTWYFFCSADPFFVSLFQFLTFLNIYIAVGYISDRLTLDTDRLTYNIEYVIIRLCLYLIIIPVFFKYIRPGFRQLVDTLDTEWRNALLVPFLFLLLQICMLYYPVPYWHWEGDPWRTAISVIAYALFAAMYYLLYIQSSAIVRKNILEKRDLLMTQQNKLWEAEFYRREQADCLLRQQRHDLRHHNAVIINLLKEGLSGQLMSYMESFHAKEAYDGNKEYTKNPIVNSICNVYKQQADRAGIEMQLLVRVPENLAAIHSVDLTCIVCNILENAFEGCQRLPEDIPRNIDLKMKYMENRLYLQVKNTCVPDIVFEEELPVTQKEKGGTGIKSVLYTAEKYQGTANFYVEEGIFFTQIVLNTQVSKPTIKK